jgi:hypothetical protein
MKLNLFGLKGTSRYIFWGILTLLMGVVAGIFRIDDYILKPQHAHWEHFQAVSESIQQSAGYKQIAYYLFFAVNLLWAYTSLYIMYQGVKDLTKSIYPKTPLEDRNGDYRDPKPSRVAVRKVYLFFAVLAFVADVMEGILYVSFSEHLLQQIVYIKHAMYAICLLFYLGYIFEKYVHKQYRNITRFLGTSILSLAFIGLVYILLTLMAQGGTLVVDLVNSGWNVFLLFFLLIFLAIILAHYPTYFEIWWFGNNDIMRIRKARFWPKSIGSETLATILKKGNRELVDGKNTSQTEIIYDDPNGLGVIYYDTGHASSEARDRYNNEDIKRWRRSLGILLYVAFFNIFLRVTSQYFELNFDVMGITIVILAIALFRYDKEGQRYNYWRKTLKQAASNSKKSPDAEMLQGVITDIYTYAKRFPSFVGLSLLSSTITSILASSLGWSVWTLVMVFVTLILHTYLYIYFKICRTYLKYVFFSERLYNRNPNMYDARYIVLFHNAKAVVNNAHTFISFCSGNLSNNIVFILIMSVSGLISLVLIILSNMFFGFASNINPINIIALYIITLYGVFFVLFKIVLYYNRNAKGLKSNYFKRLGIPIIGVILLGWIFVSTSLDSDLHELTLLPSKTVSEPSVQSFLEKLQSTDRATTGNNYFYVGSFGGGLKANLWNTLLFYELDSLSDKRFFHKTVAMSGVSGGAVGIGNYASLRYNAKGDYAKMRKQIDDVALSNVLSYELTFLMGWDFCREIIPFLSYEGKDRSYYSMRSHARLTGMGDDEFNTITYRDYWRKMYEASSASFPILITNTTSTLGKQGVASSLKMPDAVFSGADNILDFSGENMEKSLSYFGAISTTNRFPLFSPTAEIPSKGHYLDGGYFDNSGLLSVLELHEHFEYLAEREATIDTLNPVFINIINSKGYYVARKIKEWKVVRASGDPGVGELSAIIETVMSIDKFPRYVSAKIRNRKFILEEIFMPHKIHYNDVTAQFKGDVADPIGLMKKIKAHNDSIDVALKAYDGYDMDTWGVVEPPLARLLSEPAVRYQEAMVKHHPDVQSALLRILGYLAEKKEVKIQDQERLKTAERLNVYQRQESLKEKVKGDSKRKPIDLPADGT